MNAKVLQMPDLPKLVLEHLFRAHPEPISFIELMRRIPQFRPSLWTKALVDLEEQEFISESYAFAENRTYFEITERGRMQLLGYVLSGASKALPLAETPREQASGLSTNLAAGADGETEVGGFTVAANSQRSLAASTTADKSVEYPASAGINLASVSGHSASEDTLGRGGLLPNPDGPPTYLTSAEIVDKVSMQRKADTFNEFNKWWSDWVIARSKGRTV